MDTGPPDESALPEHVDARDVFLAGIPIPDPLVLTLAGLVGEEALETELRYASPVT
jgi:hypothetical protein